jgi:hypothetical protein
MKTIIFCLMFGLCAAAWALPVRGVGCAPTAEAAVAHLLSDTDAGRAANGFRVDAVRLDRVHARAWAMVASCESPAAPRVAVALPGEAIASVAQRGEALVHAGERVVVVSAAGSHMQLEGWAEESGAQKQQVRVRLDSSVMGDGVGARMKCVVVRAGVVEAVR